jgi:site-specific recombinase XerD
MALLKKIEEQNFSPWTIRMYRVTLRKFFRWLGKEELVNWFKITIKTNETNCQKIC